MVEGFQLQAAIFLTPAAVDLYSDLHFLAGFWSRLSVHDFHFNLPQQCHDLLRLVPFDWHNRIKDSALGPSACYVCKRRRPQLMP